MTRRKLGLGLFSAAVRAAIPMAGAPASSATLCLASLSGMCCAFGSPDPGVLFKYGVVTTSQILMQAEHEARIESVSCRSSCGLRPLVLDREGFVPMEFTSSQRCVSSPASRSA